MHQNQDPRLIIYNAMVEVNGVICCFKWSSNKYNSLLKHIWTGKSRLKPKHHIEPDEFNFTPRISGVFNLVCLFHLCSQRSEEQVDNDQVTHVVYPVPRATPGVGVVSANVWKRRELRQHLRANHRTLRSDLYWYCQHIGVIKFIPEV